ncbi:hypothetical protein CCP4SC76_6680001 [Gammaproteobacteria bacterium]
MDVVAIPAHGAIGAWLTRRWSVATGSHAGAWEPGRSVNREMKDARFGMMSMYMDTNYTSYYFINQCNNS